LLDLRFEAEWINGGLALGCEYKTDLFAPETIRHLLASYQQILQALIENPARKLLELQITEALQSQARQSRNRQPEQTLSIAATFTAEPIEESLQYWAKELEQPVKVEFAPYNQIFQQLLDPNSGMVTNQRGLNVLLIRPEDWLGDDKSQTTAGGNPDRTAQDFITALKSATARTVTPFLVLLCPASKAVASDPERKRLVDAAERFLTAEVEKSGGAHLVTASDLLKLYPVADYYDATGDELGRVPYTPVFFTALGTMATRKLHALQRAPHKVIVLDLDQTLWSGVCGEDGAKGICVDGPRKALQEFMRAQQAAGRLLTVCSKNNEADVLEVFSQRVDMPLRHEHFSAWRTNWNPKSENIKSIARELNLGLDSFIFVDDNPIECAEVEANCPEVLTLQLPDDPGQIPQFLNHCWVFDHTRITTEDRKRSELYRENRKREQLRNNSMGLADFITSLKLQIEIAPMSPPQLERVAQLTHRTNQFNCTTLRRSEADIQNLAETAEILTVSVRDRFGDYGLVGVVICSSHDQMLDVETFLLSCRVLGRGVEHAILARLGTLALEKKLGWVDVHYHRSEKNKPASDFLEAVGAVYRQALNGGFIYRFPAQAAAEITFNPQKLETRQNETEASPADQRLAAPATHSPNKFHRCRFIAMEANDPEKIHRAMEASVTTRFAKQGSYTPPNTEMERQLCAIWEKLLRVERVGLQDNFFELGGHSLLAVRLFAELETLTQRKFPLVTIFQTPTVEQLAQVLSASQFESSRSPIVPVQPNGSRPPLFLAHGAGGDVLWGYANLAKHLPPDQPIYGIKSRGQIGLEEYDRIEDMARYYVEEIRAFQKHGPYYLGGYCLGGNVAYEMARQLKAQGEEIALVVLIDAFPSNAGYERITWWRPRFFLRFVRNVWYWLEDFEEQTAKERVRFVARKTRMLARKLRSKLNGQKGNPTDVDLEEVIDPTYFPEHELKFWEIHLRALTNHVERPFDGSVTLIRTRGQPLLCSFEDDFCWGRLAKAGAIVKRIPGSHENIFIEPNVKFLAQQLETSISEVGTAATQSNPETINA
jgi:FkbH-like protein